MIWILDRLGNVLIGVFFSVNKLLLIIIKVVSNMKKWLEIDYWIIVVIICVFFYGCYDLLKYFGF